ncbi:MAG: TIGR01548 family HAD-type hydrolase [Cyanobacteria bacterium]|nr:TIGR01548 family HAD-type hydrolase [Cyanobacteriota bacterium]
MAVQAIAVFDIDGVIRDVGGSYRRALADTVEHFTQGAYRPSPQDIDALKAEGIWNNDWEGSQELVYRYFEQQGQGRSQFDLNYDTLVDFFQRRYRGPNLDDPSQWTGYISQEPVLITPDYFESLTQHHVAWGFFSGATRGSATYILEERLGLHQPKLVAMEDAPGKPDPTGLLAVAAALGSGTNVVPILYIGDTVADMQTIQKAQQQRPEHHWLGVGILPPHVSASDAKYIAGYTRSLMDAGAHIVLPALAALTPACIQQLIAQAGYSSRQSG